MRTGFSVLLLAAVPLLAHHSLFGTYDPNRPVTIQGVVTKVLIRNPHSFIVVGAKDENGNVVEWDVEVAAAGVLASRGWGRDTVKTGDAVTVSGYRGKENAGRAVAGRVVLGDGRELMSWPSGTIWPNPTESEFLNRKQ